MLAAPHPRCRLHKHSAPRLSCFGGVVICHVCSIWFSLNLNSIRTPRPIKWSYLLRSVLRLLTLLICIYSIYSVLYTTQYIITPQYILTLVCEDLFLAFPCVKLLRILIVYYSGFGTSWFRVEPCLVHSDCWSPGSWLWFRFVLSERPGSSGRLKV